ncbi:SDR family NAD(P)-dependent oxidoreductase [Streptomyces mirabilis]|uniref:SDR family NAD(P)-dependent oxidoreductase n=1 Tax=Streptomyces mirabilis TaxID=68239 RepID=UPI0036EDD478
MPLPLDHVPLLHQDAVLNADEEAPRNWAAQWTSEWSEPTAVIVRRAVKSRTGTGKFVDTGVAGRIVIVSSMGGLLTVSGLGAYCAGKHALAATLRDELAPTGITVQTINPGPYETGFNDRMADAGPATGVMRPPPGSYRPEERAGSVRTEGRPPNSPAMCT